MRPEDSHNQIFIRGLKVSCQVGVPDEERAQAQELLIHITMARHDLPKGETLADDIKQTIDYHAVALRVEELSLIHI